MTPSESLPQNDSAETRRLRLRCETMQDDAIILIDQLHGSFARRRELLEARAEVHASMLEMARRTIVACRRWSPDPPTLSD